MSYHTGMDDDAPREPEKCKVCDKPVLVMIRRGSGICGENCEKVLTEDG